MEINYKKSSYRELIEMIKDCQVELKKRGTITQCKNVFWTKENKAKVVLIKSHSSSKV